MSRKVEEPTTLEAAQKRIRSLTRKLKRAENERDAALHEIIYARQELAERSSEAILTAQGAEKAHTKTWYGHGSLVNRAQAAYARTNLIEQHGTWSNFVERAVVEKTLELESRLNDGREFDPVVGGVRTGPSLMTDRPWGSAPRSKRDGDASDGVSDKESERPRRKNRSSEKL